MVCIIFLLFQAFIAAACATTVPANVWTIGHFTESLLSEPFLSALCYRKCKMLLHISRVDGNKTLRLHPRYIIIVLPLRHYASYGYHAQ